MVGSLVLLAPLAALSAFGAAVPVGFAFLAARRGRAAARILGLRAAPPAPGLLRTAAAAGICALLGLAAAQPVLETSGGTRVRRSSQVLFVLDVSRSMLASSGPDGPTRLERAKDVVLHLRRAVPDVPAGIAGLTDRVLPYVFATSDETTFESVLRRSVAVEAPPPEAVARNATSFGSLEAVPTSGFFEPSVTRRTCVLVTDGESAPYSSSAVAAALRGAHGCSLLVVRVGGTAERVYGADGRPEAAYRPDEAADSTVRRLAEVTGGRDFDAGDSAAAAAALRRLAEAGPTGRTTLVARQRRLGPLLAATALTLAVGLGVATVRPRSVRRRAAGAYSGAVSAEDHGA
ncbi:MAG TPA: VWA domain-containing protein [Gaiella sp.]|nr:VWA domain-containing protein [Gaiella sp.]